MNILIFLGAPPHFYARMQTRSSTSKRSAEQPQQHHRSVSPDAVPTMPPNRSVASDDENDGQLDLSDDDNDEDDMLPVHGAS